MIETLSLELCEPGNEEIGISLLQQGDGKELWGLISATKEGEYVVRVSVDHQESETRGRVVIRGIVSGGARLKLIGEVKINPNIVNTEDNLDFRLLILDDKSQAEVVPQMEIAANKVNASHAISVGRVDRGELYYLMSRGLTQKESEELIIQGFFKVVTDKMREVNLEKT